MSSYRGADEVFKQMLPLRACVYCEAVVITVHQALLAGAGLLPNWYLSTLSK